MKKENKIVKQMMEDGFDIASIKDALCDGEYLAKTGMTKEEAEEAYNFCDSKEKKGGK